MKNYFLHFMLFALLSGCAKTTDPEPTDPKEAALKPRTIGGEWVADKGGAGGNNNYDSFKNFQYNFIVGFDNQEVSIELSSNVIDVQFAIYNPNGTKIYTSSSSRSEATLIKLNTGTYRMVVSSARRAVGKFQFNIIGIIGNPSIIPSEILQSGIQNFGVLGGAGSTYSFKNQFYTFDVVEDNFSIDVELESSDTDIELLIYDPLGKSLNYSFFNERYRYNVLAVKKGTYTVMVATNKRGDVGNYKLNVFGKVQNLKKVVTQLSTIKGNWANNSAVDTYSLQLTANSSPIDIELLCPDAKGFIDFQNSTGKRIVYTVLPSTSVYIVRQDVAKGEYRIEVYPSKNNGFGNYTLNVHGQFTDFKKL
jgi:hypothetical protein